MRILKKDLGHGRMKLLVETQDDLWHLSHVIEQGDIVTGKAERKIKMGDEGSRAKSAKKVFTARVGVEKAVYEPKDRELRVSGTLAEEREFAPAGSHQSISVEQGSVLTIEKKEWLRHHLQRIERASRQKKGAVLIVVHDREEAILALTKEYGCETIANLKGDVEKKAETRQSPEDFYGMIAKQAKEAAEKYGARAVIVASPAFFSEYVVARLKKEGLAVPVIRAGCSSVSHNALNEVIKREETKKVLEEETAAFEEKAVEELLERIAKGEPCAYGAEETRAAAEAGAVETLLVTDKYLEDAREKGEGRAAEDVMRAVERANGKIIIVSSRTEAGQRLDGLGGTGGILRYRFR